MGLILLSPGLSLKSPMLIIFALGLDFKIESIIFLFNFPAKILPGSLLICPPDLDGQ